MSGPNAEWDRPVELKYSSSGSLIIAGPFQALVHLTEEWPAEQGLEFVRARSACRGAIAGHRSMADARKAFEAAAQQARQQFDKRRN